MLDLVEHLALTFVSLVLAAFVLLPASVFEKWCRELWRTWFGKR